MDSFGNVPIFLAILQDIPHYRKYKILARELIIALVAMVLFNYMGSFLLKALQINTYSVHISGGIILFLISLKMIFPPSKSPSSPDAKIDIDKEPFIVPLAIPLIAGPAVLAAIILYSEKRATESLLAIICAWSATAVILLAAPFLDKLLGKKGLTACERLMGLILTMLSVQMLLSGLSNYIKSLQLS
jgi:multiple antibiotic resistance protein